jgi:hypothetical protein
MSRSIRWLAQLAALLAASACHPYQAAEPGSLPACFVIEPGPWTISPSSGYEFNPIRLILGSADAYSDFFQEVVGRVAVIIGADSGPESP